MYLPDSVNIHISDFLMILEFSRIMHFLIKGWKNIMKFDESYSHINFYFYFYFGVTTIIIFPQT